MKLAKWFGLGLFFSLAAFANTEQLSTPAVGAIRTRLCDFWTYESEVNGYACTFLSPTVTLVEARDFEDQNRRLLTKIDDLERRIRVLEK